jgi:drug/metabolite transporter superfamily protein YnfA
MTKETGGGGFIKPVLFEEADDALVTQFSRLLKTVHGLVDPEEAVPLAGRVYAHPGLYYAVLHSTVVVHGFFNRRNDGDGGSCDRS